MINRLGFFLLAVSLVGCGDDSQSPAAPAPASEEVEPAPSVEEPPPPPTNVRDIAGIEVTLNDDGSVQVRGANRWGRPLDALYTDHTYFRNAVPVLERSITEEQAAGLNALLAELGSAEAPAAEGPAEDEANDDEASPSAEGEEESPAVDTP